MILLLTIEYCCDSVLVMDDQNQNTPQPNNNQQGSQWGNPIQDPSTQNPANNNGSEPMSSPSTDQDAGGFTPLSSPVVPESTVSAPSPVGSEQTAAPEAESAPVAPTSSLPEELGTTAEPTSAPSSPASESTSSATENESSTPADGPLGSSPL